MIDCPEDLAVVIDGFEVVIDGGFAMEIDGGFAMEIDGAFVLITEVLGWQS